MVLFLVAHSLSELTSYCNTDARFLEILIGDVGTLSATHIQRITKQEIAFAVQAVDAILANHHTRILFKSHLECDVPALFVASRRTPRKTLCPFRSFHSVEAHANPIASSVPTHLIGERRLPYPSAAQHFTTSSESEQPPLMPCHHHNVPLIAEGIHPTFQHRHSHVFSNCRSNAITNGLTFSSKNVRNLSPDSKLPTSPTMPRARSSSSSWRL